MMEGLVSYIKSIGAERVEIARRCLESNEDRLVEMISRYRNIGGIRELTQSLMGIAAMDAAVAHRILDRCDFRRLAADYSERIDAIAPEALACVAAIYTLNVDAGQRLFEEMESRKRGTAHRLLMAASPRLPGEPQLPSEFLAYLRQLAQASGQ